jgi:hypothetical protein
MNDAVCSVELPDEQDLFEQYAIAQYASNQ